MAITRIGSAAGAGNTLTMPAHQAGDLLLMFAYRDGSTTPPVLRDGWTNVLNGGTATNSCRIAYKIAESSSEIADSWGTASSLICVVYRADGTIGVGASARSSSASTTISYPALTLNNTDGTSWVVGFGGHRSIDTAVETPPTGMVNLVSVLDGTDEAAGHDTNGPVSSWSLQTVSVGGTSSGWNGATVEITEVAPPTPPAGDNPATIMASAAEVDLFFDAAQSDLFQDTAATTAATADGDPVNFIAALWGNDFVAGASSGRNAVLRLPSGDDPYLEAVPGASQLRASLARSGDLYVICRGRWNGTANDQEAFWTLTNNASQFYTGNFMVPRYFPFGFNYIQTETSVGYAVTTSAVAITRGVWSTLEIWVSGSTIYTAVDGGTPETYAASGPLGDTTLMDIFGSLDGGVTGSFAVDIRRLAVLNDIPDSTERANLLDWAENGDAGGGAGTDALTSQNLAAGAPVLGAPTLAQSHELSAAALASGAPILGAPALSQAHALAATGMVSGAPVLGAPAIAQGHVLTVSGIAAGAPVLGAPALGQVHALGATGLVAGAPVLGTPALGSDGSLVAENLVTGAPVLGAPALGQIHALAGVSLATGQPILGAPAIAQAHALAAVALATLAPVLGSPPLGQAHVLSSVPLVAGAPVLGAPALVVVHSLGAIGITTGAPALGAPLLSSANVLMIEDLVLGAPILGAPALGQIHVLSPWSFFTPAPILGAPALLELPAGFVYPFIRSGLRSSAVTLKASGGGFARALGGTQKATPKSAGAARSNILKD